MPVYKDKYTSKWFCKFYYTEPKTGESKQKMKRGFNLKREAEAYEREFLTNLSYSPSMLFAEFYERYKDDRYPKLAAHTVQSKKYQMKRILPFFARMPIDEISPRDVTQWHNKLIEDGLKQTTMINLHRCLSAVFNHAMRFYGLASNPCKIAGLPKTRNRTIEPMRFWTIEEFKAVNNALIQDGSDTLLQRTLLNLMYWTGIRKGELYALTWGDFELDKAELTVSQSYQRLSGEEVITPTKTGLDRVIRLPDIVLKLLKKYKATVYDSSPDAPVFPYKKELIENSIKQGSKLAEVPVIHVHGLRHSNASALISLGVNIVLISKRLGHEKVSTTLNTYSHFFPDDEVSAVEAINKTMSDTDLILENGGGTKNKRNERLETL